MADGMFGAPTGVRAFQKDAQESILNEISAHQKMADLAMAPARQELLGQQVRKYGLEADKLQTELTNEKRWAEALALRASGAGDKTSPLQANGQPKSAGTQLYDLAELAMGVGATDKAIKFYDAGSKVTSAEARAAASAATQRVRELEARGKNLNLLASSVRGSKDQASWARNNALYASITGQPSPFANVPYSPELVKQLETSVLTVKDALQLEAEELKRRDLQNYRGARLSQHRAALDIQERRAQIAADAERRRAKNGGKVASSPNTSDVLEANRLIKKDFPSITSDARQEAAYAVAGRAKSLVKNNPGLDMPTALRRALAEQRANFSTEVSPLVPDWLGGSKTKFTPKGAGVELPLTVTGKPDESKMKPGTVYKFPTGLGRYVGGGQVEMVDELAEIGGVADDDDEDEDD